jgi:4-amino-4-deoxy-L-arabinose transferase-like glycosyltransferase
MHENRVDGTRCSNQTGSADCAPHTGMAEEAGPPPRVWVAPRSDRQCLMLLLGLSIVINAWLIAHSVVVATDGYGFIRTARRMDRKPFVEVVCDLDQHPLFPTLLNLLSKPVLASRLWPAAEAWEIAGQALAAAFSVLLVLPMFLLGKELFDRPVAFWATLLFHTLPVPAQVAADCLSDSTYLFFLVSGVYLAVRAVHRVAPWWLVAAMASTGLAYLTRPEGLLLAPLIVAFVAVAQCVPRLRWPARTLARVGTALLVTAAVLVVPYVALKGDLSGRPSYQQLTAQSAAANGQPLGAALRELQREVRHCNIYGLGWFMLGELVFGWRGCRVPGRWLALALAGTSLAAVTVLATAVGYISERHVLTFQAMTLYYTAAGAFRSAGWVGWLVDHWPWQSAHWAPLEGSVVAGRLARLVLGGTVVGCLLIISGSRLHVNRAAHVEAAAWLRQHTTAQDAVVDFTGIASLHAGRTRLGLWYGEHDMPVATRPRYLVVEENDIRPSLLRPQARLTQLLNGARPAARFPEVPRRGVNRVRVFELPEPDERLTLAVEPLNR